MARVSESTKREHRQRLLDAAAAEFAAKGLDGARVDDISLAAGLAKGTIYNYFDSKLDVFRAVIIQWAERIGDAREEVPDEAPIRDQLLAIVRADMEVTGQIEEFAKTAFREILNAPSEVVAGLFPEGDPFDGEILRVVTLARAGGELRADRSPEELARLFTTLVNGLLLEHWLAGDEELALADIPDLAVDYYLEGAARR